MMLKVIRADAEYYYSLSSESLASIWLLKSILNPSLRAAMLFRLAANSTGLPNLLARTALQALHGCDVASGARFSGPIYLPHPVGIVVGSGVILGSRVWIFQNVTLGKDGANHYPEVGDDSRLFPGCVVVGNVTLSPNSRVSALQFVSASTVSPVEN